LAIPKKSDIYSSIWASRDELRGGMELTKGSIIMPEKVGARSESRKDDHVLFLQRNLPLAIVAGGRSIRSGNASE
jgi:hypothetical protein